MSQARPGSAAATGRFLARLGHHWNRFARRRGGLSRSRRFPVVAKALEFLGKIPLRARRSNSFAGRARSRTSPPSSWPASLPPTSSRSGSALSARGTTRTGGSSWPPAARSWKTASRTRTSGLGSQGFRSSSSNGPMTRGCRRGTAFLGFQGSARRAPSRRPRSSPACGCSCRRSGRMGRRAPLRADSPCSPACSPRCPTSTSGPRCGR